MWDNARQLNAIALVVAFAAATMLAWGAVAWAVRQPVFAFQRGRHRRPAAARQSRASRGGDPRGAQGDVLHDASGRCAGSLQRVPWVRRVALAPPVAGPARGRSERAPAARPLERCGAGRHRRRRLRRRLRRRPAAVHRTRGHGGGSRGAIPRVRRGTRSRPGARSARSAARRAAAGRSSQRAVRPLTIELGRAEPGEHLARFVAHYRQTLDALSRGGARIDYADLRYRNGFAARVSGGNDRSSRKASRG